MNDGDLLIPSSTTEDDDDVAVSMAVEVTSAIASAASEIRKVMSDKCSCCGNVRDKDDVVLIFCFESEDLGGDNGANAQTSSLLLSIFATAMRIQALGSRDFIIVVVWLLYLILGQDYIVLY